MANKLVMVKIDHQTIPLRDAVRMYGLASYDVVYTRIREGWSVKQALLKFVYLPNRTNKHVMRRVQGKKRGVFYNGEKMTLKRCVELHGVLNYQTVASRLHQGWGLHEALTTPKIRP